MSECKYCKKESYGRPFCVECGKKYFGFEAPLTIESTNTIKKTKPQKATNKSIKNKLENENTNKYFSNLIKENEEYLSREIKENEEYLSQIQNQIIKDFQRNLKETNYIKTNTQNRICEICGACSYNMQYCYSCYNSFIKGNNYNHFKQFEDEKIYTCKSGIKVRSLSEREISNFLTDNNIPHIYEKEIKYKFKNYYYQETFIKSLHPDFYIPGPINFKGKIIQDIYIEFWGFDENSNNATYINSKRFKIKNYKEMGITLINLNKNDLNNVEESLTYKLLNYQKNTINY